MKIGRDSRRSIRYLIFIGVLAGSVFSGSGAFAVDPIPISTQADLEAIGSSDGARGGDYFLNFVGSELALTNPSNSTYVTGTFTGTFDGNGKTLSGLTKPLFEIVGTNSNSAEIFNLTLSTATGTGVQGRGVLANDVFNSTIDDVSANGKVTSTSSADIGGLIGKSIDVNIDQSTTNVIVASTGENVGGLVGRIENTQIQNSIASGTVTGGSSVGGLVGKSSSSSIETSQGSGSVSTLEATVSNTTVHYCVSGTCNWINLPTFTSQQNIGGLIGESSGSTIVNSSSEGMVSGSKNIGGLIGNSTLDTVTNTSFAGEVTGESTRLNRSMGFDPTSGNNFLYYTETPPENIGGLIGTSTSAISNSYVSGNLEVNGGTNVGGLVGNSSGEIETSYIFSQGEVYGTGNYVGGLVGYSSGTISDSYVVIEGRVAGNNIVGGLAGYANGVERTYANAAVVGNNSVGGLVGEAHVLVNNSYSTGLVTGNSLVGGLVGDQYGNITNSFSTGSVTGVDRVGGLVGWSDVITNSYETGSVTGEIKVGGLAGLSEGNISNSYATGNVNGDESVGGLVGEINYNSTVTESYATGNVIGTTQNIGSFAGYVYGDVLRSYSLGTVSGTGTHIGGFAGDTDGGAFSWIDDSCAGSLVGGNFSCTSGTVDSDFILGEIGTESGVGNLGAAFDSSNECLNGGNPYLVALINSYVSSCSGGDSGENVTTRRVRERELRETKELIPALKIEKAIGFKNGSSLLNNAAISFVETTEKIDITKVKSVEITATANVKVNTKAGEALQISLKSESKEPVELWVKSPDGSWLLVGVITFDKDGKAILPPLQFKNAGDYSLVLSKPSADSAKGNAPLNQTGSLLVAVS